MQWPAQPRNLFCIFPLKTSLKMKKKKRSPFFAEALQESISKITELCTHKHRHACSHTYIRIKESCQICSWESTRKGWQEKIWKFDQLKMLECYSDGKEVVLGTYKKEGGQAERMINPGYQRLSVGHAGVKDKCQFVG